jgi:hypothetical protein
MSKNFLVGGGAKVVVIRVLKMASHSEATELLIGKVNLWLVTKLTHRNFSQKKSHLRPRINPIFAALFVTVSVKK